MFSRQINATMAWCAVKEEMLYPQLHKINICKPCNRFAIVFKYTQIKIF